MSSITWMWIPLHSPEFSNKHISLFCKALPFSCCSRDRLYSIWHTLLTLPKLSQHKLYSFAHFYQFNLQSILLSIMLKNEQQLILMELFSSISHSKHNQIIYGDIRWIGGLSLYRDRDSQRNSQTILANTWHEIDRLVRLKKVYCEYLLRLTIFTITLSGSLYKKSLNALLFKSPNIQVITDTVTDIAT